jgi:hypothetical protein
MSIDYCDPRFDSELVNIRPLPWLPWVGDKYEASGVKLIILGESCYDSKNERIPDFTRKCIGEWFGLSLSPKSKMHRNLERVILGDNPHADEDKKTLWRTVCYHNLVLRFMSSNKERPVWNDYVEGWKVFFDLAGILNPTHCLFAGTDWEKLNSFKEVASSRKAEINGVLRSDKISGAYGTKLDVKSDKYSFCLVFMMHPSSRNFSWRKWSPFIHQFIPNPLDGLAP